MKQPPIKHDENFLLDKQVLWELVRMMPPDEHEEYVDYKSLALESAFEGRRFVVFDLEEGEPTRIESIELTEFSIPAHGEPQCLYTYQKGLKRVQAVIGLVPTRFSDRELFLSIPAKFEFRWGGRQKGSKVEFHPHFAILIKTRHKWHWEEDGHTYCLTLANFIKSYPTHAKDARV